MATGSVPVKLNYHDVVCTRNYLIMATGSVPVRLPQILLSLLAQANTNTNGTLTSSFAKEFTKYLFRLPINLYIQTKHHPVAVSKWGGEERIQNQYIFKNRVAPIYTTFIHVIKYLFLQMDCGYL